jgi:spore germination cell wall hydrolase CwlJ-like protein
MIQPPSELQLLAWTVWQEASGEPYEGKLAVACVIMNRVRQGKASICRTIFQPWQFSCWNTDSPTRLRLPEATGTPWAECAKAALVAYEKSAPDPSLGATHYLNEKTVMRVAKKLPSWFDPNRITARIGAHTFLRL